MAAKSPDREICGLLLGAGNQVVTIVPAENVAADPAHHFEIDPAILIKFEKEARVGGPQILGHYHSHPNGRAEPSGDDARNAVGDGRIWLIITEHGITAWRAVLQGWLHGRFDPVELVTPDG